MARTVLIGIDDNQGYAPDQISTAVTLEALLESVQNAIEEFGADAKVVLYNGQRYGAGFGRFQAYGSDAIISDANPDEDEDGNEYDTSEDGL
jgi:succinyl-CoA synthetase alpha subunit